ncbi:MAG: hypothetical protein GC161_06255 [Planctomycetaceae bacterium]|nr:hypothetical protein [Planctomycetaceae bacterium]
MSLALALVLLAPSVAAQTPNCEPDWLDRFGGQPNMAEVPRAIEFMPFDGVQQPVIACEGDVYGTISLGVVRWDAPYWRRVGTRLPLVYDLHRVQGSAEPELYAASVAATPGSPTVWRLGATAWEAVGDGPGLASARVVQFLDTGIDAALWAAGAGAGPSGVGVTGAVASRWDGAAWIDEPPVTPSGTVRALVAHDFGQGPEVVAAVLPAFGVALPHTVRRLEAGVWVDVGAGVTNAIALALFPTDDGPRLVAAGGIAADTPLQRVLMFDGANWNTVGLADGQVLALSMHDLGDGPRLYAGGSFGSIDGVQARGIARWDGASWSDLGQSGGPGRVDTIHAVGGPRPKLLVGGDLRADFGQATTVPVGQFTTPLPRPNFFVWDGTAWEFLSETVEDAVDSAVVHDDGQGESLFVAGTFETAGGKPAQRVAAWNGSKWRALGAGLDGRAYALESHDGGSGALLFAGGVLETDGAGPKGRVAQWDGTTWSDVGGAGFNGRVLALHSHVESLGSPAKLFAAGQFTAGDGAPLLRIARWDGVSWSPVGGGIGVGSTAVTPFVDVRALTTFDDGQNGPRLIVAGSFANAGGKPMRNLAAWDGTEWKRLGIHLNGELNALHVHDDGQGPALYVGGDFFFPGATSEFQDLARWDGTTWSALPAWSSGRILALGSFDDDRDGVDSLFIAGNSGSFLGAGHIRRWNGTAFEQLGSGLHSSGTTEVRTLLPFTRQGHADPELVVAGQFTQADFRPSNGLASFGCPSAPLFTVWAPCGDAQGELRPDDALFAGRSARFALQRSPAAAGSSWLLASLELGSPTECGLELPGLGEWLLAASSLVATSTGSVDPALALTFDVPVPAAVVGSQLRFQALSFGTAAELSDAISMSVYP